MNKLYIVPTDVGWCGVVVCQEQLVVCSLPQKSKEIVIKKLKGKVDISSVAENSKNKIFLDLINYFKGKKVNFKGKISLDGFTDFQKKVLKETQKIKYGRTITYKQLAEMINHPRAARAVGSALRKNKLPVIIPCHRVIKSNKKIGEYSAGKKWKHLLLNMEKHMQRNK